MDTLINYAGLVIGLILAIIGIYLQIKSTKKKEPVYSIKSNNLLSGSSSTLENLTVAYKDQKVENLTVSKILFYNRGTETITSQDIDTINHLKISSETCKILDGSILQTTNMSNNFQVRYENKTEYVYIDFDYLDKNQGVVIQIVHTGLSSDDLYVNGDIKGIQKLIHVAPEKFEKLKPAAPMPTRDKSILSIATFVALIFWGLVIFARNYIRLLLYSNSPITNLLMVGGLMVGLMATVVPLAMLTAFIIRLFGGRNIIPMGLKKFLE